MNMVKFSITCIVAAFMGTIFGASALAQSSDSQLQNVEQNLQQQRKQSEDLNQKAASLEKELSKLNGKLVASARAVQSHEIAVINLEDQLVILRFEEAEKVKLLAEQRVQFSKVLMALERMARFPPEALIAQPGEPSDTVRSAILLRSVVPEIERRAESLRQQIEGLAVAREHLKLQKIALSAQSEMLGLESKQLAILLGQKKKLKTQTDTQSAAAAKKVRKLASEAANLRDLVAKLTAQRKAREKAEKEKKIAIAAAAAAEALAQSATSLEAAPQKPSLDSQQTEVASLDLGMLSGVPISTRQGQLPFPVVGKIISKYGQSNENGVTERGLKLKTRSAAQVIAPYEGHIAFVGEFRGYGQLLIIEHSEGYHTLLAGMSRIDSVMGQTVLIGEPVGIMNSNSGAKPILYVEFRRAGKPINPLPWLVAQNSKANG